MKGIVCECKPGNHHYGAGSDWADKRLQRPLRIDTLRQEQMFHL